MSEIEFKVKSISVVLKLSEICNLACTYCYYYESDVDQEWRSRPQFIDEETIVVLTARLLEFVATSEAIKLKVVFHGGEPTLLAPDVVNFICRYMRIKLGHLLEVSFSLQTNGFFLSRAWLETIHKHQIEVGISVDGKPAVHDKFRITQTGKPSSAGIRKTIQKLNQFAHGGDPISVGVIAVVDENTDIPGVLEYFEDTLQVEGVNFLLRSPTGQANELASENPARFGGVLKSIFDSSLSRNGIYFHELESLLAAIRGQPKYNHATVDQSIYYPAIALCVHTDGTFGIDDSLLTVGKWYKALKKYNISTSSIADLLSDEKIMAYHTAYFSVPDDCKKCKFSNACAGGRPKFRYNEENEFNNKSAYCQSYFEFYDHVVGVLIEAGYPAERIWKALSNN